MQFLFQYSFYGHACPTHVFASMLISTKSRGSGHLVAATCLGYCLLLIVAAQVGN